MKPKSRIYKKRVPKVVPVSSHADAEEEPARYQFGDTVSYFLGVSADEGHTEEGIICGRLNHKDEEINLQSVLVIVDNKKSLHFVDHSRILQITGHDAMRAIRLRFTLELNNPDHGMKPIVSFSD